MKKAIFIIIILLVAGGIVVFRGKTPQQEVTMQMTDDGFLPQNIEIPLNSKVNFANVGKNAHWPASNIHPSHLIYPEFDPKKGIPSGQTWSFVFDKAGIWRYHDHLYPEVGGTIRIDN